MRCGIHRSGQDSAGHDPDDEETEVGLHQWHPRDVGQPEGLPQHLGHHGPELPGQHGGRLPGPSASGCADLPR